MCPSCVPSGSLHMLEVISIITLTSRVTLLFLWKKSILNNVHKTAQYFMDSLCVHKRWSYLENTLIVGLLIQSWPETKLTHHSVNDLYTEHKVITKCLLSSYLRLIRMYLFLRIFKCIYWNISRRLSVFMTCCWCSGGVSRELARNLRCNCSDAWRSEFNDYWCQFWLLSLCGP